MPESIEQKEKRRIADRKLHRCYNVTNVYLHRVDEGQLLIIAESRAADVNAAFIRLDRIVQRCGANERLATSEGGGAVQRNGPGREFQHSSRGLNGLTI